MMDGEGALPDADSSPDMNGDVVPDTPDADSTAACNGVHPDEVSEGSNNTSETPAEAPEVSPEVYKDMPELVSDNEGDDVPIPTFQRDEEWRHAILNFKVKGADFIRAGQIISESVFDLNGNAATDKATPGTRANGQSNHQAAKDRSKKGAPTDVEWLQKMEMEEQEKQGGSKLSPEETSRRKAAAEAEVQRNLELEREERQRLRAEQGLVGRENIILAHCVLRPGVVEGAVCEKADDGCAIRGSEKYLKVVCTEGCSIHYHYGCWRAFERVHKTEYPDFSWKSKDRIKCFTDGCDGVIKLALELQFDSGIEISRRELLKLPDEPKKAAPAPAQPAEPRKKANKQKPAQKAPAANAEEGTAKDRATRLASMDRAAVTPSPDPAPEAKVEPTPPALDFPEVNFVQKRRDDDEDDLKRLEMGLKGKKEKKKREKKGKAAANIVVVHPEAGYDGDQYDQQLAPVQSYAENFHAEEEPEPEPVPGTSDFPRLRHAALPAAQVSMAAKTKEPSESRHTAWKTLLALKSGSGMTAHLLIQNVDMQGLEKTGKLPAAEVEDAVSMFGPFTALVILPGHSAAVVTYLSPRFAEMAYFKLDGQLLAKKKVQLSFLEQFPAEDLLVSLAEESGKPALQKRTPAEKRFREIGGQGAGQSASSPSDIGSSAGTAATPGTTDKDKLTLKALMKGAELLGLAPAAANKATKLRVAARELVPPSMTASDSPDAQQSSRHASFDGAPLTAPLPDSAGLPEAGGSDPHETQLEEELAAISCLHVLGCDEDCLANYNANARFGVELEDLAEHAERDMPSTGLVLYHIDTHELHGLWRAERLTQGGQVVAFNELHKFPPISRTMYAEALGTKEDDTLDHPLCLTGSVVQRCIQKFNEARTLASSSGHDESGMRSIAAAIKTAAAPVKAAAALTPDAPPFQPGSAAPSGGPSFPGFTPHDLKNPPPHTAVMAAPAIPAPAQPPATQPVPAVQAPAAQAPAAAAAAAPLNPMAALFSNLFPKENAPAAAPAQPAQPAAQPITQPPSPEQVPAGAANAAGAPRPGADTERAAALANFYRIPQALPESKAHISQYLQPAALGRKRSPETSPSASQLPPPAGMTMSPAPKPTPAAAPQTPSAAGGASGSTAAASSVPPTVATQAPTVALPMPAAPVAQPAAAKPPVRLVPPSGRPAYLPPTAAPRPYRPPAAPTAPQPSPAPALPTPQQQQDQQQQQSQRQTETASHLPPFTEMLLSNIQQSAPGRGVAGRPAPSTRAPAAAPVTPVKDPLKPPQPATRPPYQPPPAQGAATAELSQTTSVSSDAGSDGSSADRSKPVCRLCQQQDAVYVVLDCRHWGPCCKCVPTAQDKRLYPTCVQCGKATKMLLRAYLT